MDAVRILPSYTYEDYCQWEGRWEIIDGIPYAMAPAPSPKHQWLVINIASEFRVAFNKSECRNCKVYDFLDVKINEHTVVQPDVLVICGDIPERYIDFAPHLVVEILSESTELKDRVTKFKLYQNFGIKYYLIIHPEKEETEIYKREDEQYELQRYDKEMPFPFALSNDCNVEVMLQNIWS